jgi:hypothetical protein
MRRLLFSLWLSIACWQSASATTFDLSCSLEGRRIKLHDGLGVRKKLLAPAFYHLVQYDELRLCLHQMAAHRDAPNWITRAGLYTIDLSDDGQPSPIIFSVDTAPKEMTEFTERFNREYSRAVLGAELSCYGDLVVEVEKLRRQLVLEKFAQRKAPLENALEEKVKQMREVSPYM